MSTFNSGQKIRFIMIVILLIAVTAGNYLYLRFRGVSASELESRGQVVWQTFINKDIDNNGKLEKIYLTSYNNANDKSSYISTKNGLFGTREQKLIGFEEDLSFCPKQYFALRDGGVALCVFGEVGVHSENVQIIRFTDFSTIKFIDNQGIEHNNMTSDAPYFDFSYKQDQKIKIFFDNRNYDQDPLIDNIRSYYYLDNDVFRDDGSERLRLEGSIK